MAFWANHTQVAGGTFALYVSAGALLWFLGTANCLGPPHRISGRWGLLAPLEEIALGPPCPRLALGVIHILSNNKELEHDKLVITVSEMGSRTFPIAHEGSINSTEYLVKFKTILARIHCNITAMKTYW